MQRSLSLVIKATHKTLNLSSSSSASPTLISVALASPPSPDTWLRICEKYSRCSLSVATDRLAAFAGLVKRYPSDKPSMDPNERNLLGLWESNLRIELLWYATTRAKLKYRQDLNLPSWAWIAYDGRIFFTKDARNRRDSKTVEGAPVPEFVLAESNVPDMMTVLPLEKPAALTICVNMRSMGSISQEPTEFQSEDRRRDEVMASSHFNFDPRTGTVPIALADFSICRDVFDQAGRRIGFISFDEEVRPPTIFFALISRLSTTKLEKRRIANSTIRQSPESI